MRKAATSKIPDAIHPGLHQIPARPKDGRGPEERAIDVVAVPKRMVEHPIEQAKAIVPRQRPHEVRRNAVRERQEEGAAQREEMRPRSGKESRYREKRKQGRQYKIPKHLVLAAKAKAFFAEGDSSDTVPRAFAFQELNHAERNLALRTSTTLLPLPRPTDQARGIWAQGAPPFFLGTLPAGLSSQEDLWTIRGATTGCRVPQPRLGRQKAPWSSTTIASAHFLDAGVIANSSRPRADRSGRSRLPTLRRSLRNGVVHDFGRSFDEARADKVEMALAPAGPDLGFADPIRAEATPADLLPQD